MEEYGTEAMIKVILGGEKDKIRKRYLDYKKMVLTKAAHISHIFRETQHYTADVMLRIMLNVKTTRS